MRNSLHSNIKRDIGQLIAAAGAVKELFNEIRDKPGDSDDKKEV
jgi:hypothetical protein